MNAPNAFYLRSWCAGQTIYFSEFRRQFGGLHGPR